MHHIIKKIGISSLLEQTAEECCGLGYSCLKLSRKLRNINPTSKSYSDCINDLTEAIADVQVCLDMLKNMDFIDDVGMAAIQYEKLKRWEDELEK